MGINSGKQRKRVNWGVILEKTVRKRRTGVAKNVPEGIALPRTQKDKRNPGSPPKMELYPKKLKKKGQTIIRERERRGEERRKKKELGLFFRKPREKSLGGKTQTHGTLFTFAHPKKYKGQSLATMTTRTNQVYHL